MICKICDKIFSNHLTFKTLYQIPLLCLECTVKYKPLYSYEVIPIDDGIVEYFSVYDFEDNHPRVKRYLYRYMKNYFIELNRNSITESMFLIIDETEYLSFPLWFPIIKKFKSIRIYSLFYFDWSLYDDSVLF